MTMPERRCAFSQSNVLFVSEMGRMALRRLGEGNPRSGSADHRLRRMQSEFSPAEGAERGRAPTDSLLLESDPREREAFSERTEKVFDLWTFDRQDALKYGIGYNHQFVPYVRLERENRFDFSFIGVDKGRYAENKRIFDLLRENFRCFFCIVGNGEDEVFHREEMPYSEYLRYEAESACILDVVQKTRRAGRSESSSR